MITGGTSDIKVIVLENKFEEPMGCLQGLEYTDCIPCRVVTTPYQKKGDVLGRTLNYIW